MNRDRGMTLPSQVVDALEAVLGAKNGFLPLHKPTFEGNEGEYVQECIDTEWVSSAGSYVDRF
jgi:perosamine synthetase